MRAIHHRQLTEHGGAAGLRAAALFASALARPRNHFLDGSDPPPDLAALAAAYAFGLARNRAFFDGNKRTALVVARTFLRLNGSDLIAAADDKYLTFLRLADGILSEADLAAWFRRWSRPRP